MRHDLDCIELRTRFEKQLDRQRFYLYAFDNEALPGSSIAAATKYLLDKALLWLQSHPRAYRSSFSIWAKLSAAPWWTGQSCTCLYVGGSAADRLTDDMRQWEGFVAIESADPRRYDAVLLCYFDPTTAALHVSTPLVAVFLPNITNLAQEDSGEWLYVGRRASMAGEWVEDFTAERGAGGIFQGTADMTEFFAGSVTIHLEKLPADTLRKLIAVHENPALDHDMTWNILSNSKSVSEVERFLAQVKVVYGDTITW